MRARPQRVELVKDGILTGFWAHDPPLPKEPTKAMAMPAIRALETYQPDGNLVVESHCRHSWAKLKTTLEESMPKSKVWHHSSDVEEETEADAYDFQAFLGQITSREGVPDGTEKLVAV